MKPIVVIGAKLKLPLFRVSTPSLQTRTSYLLPPPRTLAGFFASALGKYLGLNPEQRIEESMKGANYQKELRKILMWDLFASHSVLTCRTKTYVIKSQSILKVWYIERPDLAKDESVNETSFMDAVEFEFTIADELLIYSAIDLQNFCKKLNAQVLEKVGLSEINYEELSQLLIKALRLSHRLGDSESMVTVVDSRNLQIVRVHDSGFISTATPLKWLEAEDIITHMRIIEPMPTTPLIAGDMKLSIEKKANDDILLPLEPMIDKFLYYKHSGFEAKTKKGYLIASLENGDSLVVPEQFIMG